MKSEIHPKYQTNATITCVCGNVIITGSTREKMEVEICSKCHPLYTGNEKLIDTAGRVEKFKARRAKGEAAPKKEEKTRTKKSSPANEKKPSLAKGSPRRVRLAEGSPRRRQVAVKKPAKQAPK